MLFQRSTNSEQMEALSELVSSAIQGEWPFERRRADPLESAKSWFFDTSSWRPFCDVTLTLRQARRLDGGDRIKIDETNAGRLSALRKPAQPRGISSCVSSAWKASSCIARPGKGRNVRLRVTFRERSRSGRWHVHCAIELPPHFDAVALEKLIRRCWAKVEWGYGKILVRDGTNVGWINYMLKGRQKSEFDSLLDCVIIEALHNPIADA